MEKIREFLRIETGYGTGQGFGTGAGSGQGAYDGTGSGKGFGCGQGAYDGTGSGHGAGSAYAPGSGITMLDGQAVYQVDGVPTIINKVRGNIAKGFIINVDFTFSPCYIAKGHNKFAHGTTLKKAVEDLQNKLFEDMDTDEAIGLFLKEFSDPDKKYPAKAFWVWHNRLTGSCEMGRNNFVRNGGYDLEKDTFTVQEFIDITKDAFGGAVIRQLEQTIKEGCLV